MFSRRPSVARAARYVGKVLLVTSAYVVVANLGRLAISYGIVTAVWPPSGLALAALLVFGVRVWPGVALGALLMVGFDIHPTPLPIRLPWGAALAMMVGNTLEAVVGAVLVRRLGRFSGCFDSVREVVVLLLGAVGVGSTLSATVGVVSLYGIGAVAPADLADTWWTWWVGNLLGIVVLTPFLTAWGAMPLPRPKPREVAEVALFLGLALLCASQAVFGMFPSVPRATREAYLLFPFLVWASLRFGPRGAASTVFAVSSLALASTAFRFGHFGGTTLPDTVLRLQVFVGVMSATVLLLAASVAERQHAYDELRQMKEHLEELVRRRTADLEASNRDLESFAFEVSHDLRSPLRAVRGFTNVLLDDYASGMAPEARALLDRVARGAARMSTLIDALLEYARVGRSGLHVADLEMTELVGSVVAEVLDEEALPTHVTIGELPPCRADPAMLRQVLVNLVGNAVKFTRTRPDPRIDVGAEEVGGMTAYYVRDNGVGFDARHAGTLFGAFSRLHGDAYEGTGLGLAIVQRIVLRHGGRVWADGVPGEGATFWFTLPRGAPAPGADGERPVQTYVREHDQK